MRSAVCAAVLLAASACHAAVQYFGPEEYADFDPRYHGKFLRVRRHGSFIVVRDVEWTASVGQRLQLLQKGAKHFIVVLSSDVEGACLAAFPVRERSGSGTAWVTNEGHVIFGKETESCEHRFYFQRSERLPIVDETDTTYLVMIERYGARVAVEIPRYVGGTELDIREPPPRPSEDAPKPKRVVLSGPSSDEVDALPGPGNPVPRPLRPKDAVPSEDLDPASPLVARIGEAVLKEVMQAQDKGTGGAPAEATTGEVAVAATTARPEPEPPEPVAVPDRPPVPPEPAPDAATDPAAEPDAVVAPASVPDVAVPPADSSTSTVSSAEAPATNTAASGDTNVVVDTVAEAEDAASTNARHVTEAAAVALESIPPDVVEEPPSAGSESEGGLSLLSEKSLRIEILLFVCIIEGALIVKLRRASRRTLLADASVLEFALKKKSKGDKGDGDAEGGVGADSQLSGSIAQFPVNQVIQLLNTSGETGCLWVTPGDGAGIYKLHFLNGNLIDAEKGARHGMEILVPVLRSETGSFSFKREDTSAREHHFKQDTMSLLLKATRLLDEK